MKISRLFISALCLCALQFGLCYSQQSRVQQVENQADFTGGLNTRYPSNFIGPTQTQDAQNVFFDDGSLKKRKGHAKQNNTALGGGNHDVIGLYEYNKADGTQYCVSFSSASGYVSTDKCASNSVFISTLTADQEVNCVPYNDRLYCVNGVDTPLYLSGTTYTLVPDMPACKYIRAYQNRLWCAGASAQKSYIYYSAVGDGDTWDTTFGFVAFNQEDGDVVTGIGEPIYETLPVYKRYSSWIVQGKSASNYAPIMVSNSIGATHHRSIRNLLLNNTKNIQVFSSNGIRGGEPGIYSFNGIVIQYLSDSISNKFEIMDTFKTSDRFKSFDSASDWAGGASVFIDTYTSVGSIQNTVWTDVDTSSQNFTDGTFYRTSNSTPILTSQSTVPPVGYLFLGGIDTEDFSDGDFTTDPRWFGSDFSGNTFLTLSTSSFHVTSGYIYADATSVGTSIWTNSYWNKGTIVFNYYSHNTNVLTQDRVAIVSVGPGRIINNPTYESILLQIAGDGAWYLYYYDRTGQGLICSGSGTIPKDTMVEYTIVHDGDSWVASNSYGSCSGSYNSQYMVINSPFESLFFGATVDGFWGSSNERGGSRFGGVSATGMHMGYYSTGTFTSRIFDTGLSTSAVSAPAIGGQFSVTYSTVNDSNIWFYTRSSTSPNNDNWGSWYATTDTLKVSSTQQYWQYKADFATSYSSQTPVVYDVTLEATSTGTWTSPETYLDALIGTWGLFQSVEVTTGTASWSYEMRSSTYIGGTASASWGAVTNNSLITISTGTYVQVRAKTSVNSSTDIARVDIITINYFVGSAAKSACAEVYRNRYYWFGQAQDGTENNVGYVMDSGGSWTKLVGINARSTALLGGEFYTGDSLTTDSGFIRRQDTGNSDSGNPIESYWQSKDYLFNSDDYLKTVDNVFLTFPNNNATVTTSLYADGSLSKSWDVNVSTSQPFGVKGLPVATASGNKRAKYFNLKFSNTSTDPWEILGYRLYWTTTQALQP